MAEAAAARREARRKRILENSHNRLQYISGKNSDESARASPIKSLILDEVQEIPVPEIVPHSRFSSISSINNGALVSEPESILFLPANQNIDEAGDTEIANDLAALASNLTPQPAQELSLWERLTIYKYDIVLLSILLQVFYSLFTVTIDDVYIFLPLAIYVLTKQIWSPMKPQSSIANVLLLLNGLAPARVQKMMSMALFVATFMQDVFIFIFTTICIQSLYITLKDKLHA